MRFGLIAGNGQFPLLALQAARQAGDEAVAFGIREEASERIEEFAVSTHWISLGQLGKLIELCRQEGITQLMMAGQVKHGQIFSRIRPDWKLVKVLASLASQNTDSLIGGVIRALEAEGIQLVDSTLLLKTMLAGEGVQTRRKPTREERADLDYGRRIAAALSQVDVGQSVAICERACVALEAMEGTDAMLRRAASLVEGRAICLVKGSRRRRHLLFDVPVLGMASIPVLKETRTAAIAVDSGRTLLLEKREFLQALDEIGVTLVGEPPSDAANAGEVAG
ncbi:MAG: UDP-2,3-diacylglucosamine diphosphatase LpxI [Bryobacterales bacterium]|nr:UDP-2,3-diacylglucosamine diphosphatase LpxI [Bryobacterales bacterium]